MDRPSTEFADLIRAARRGDHAASERVLVDVLPRLQAYVRLNAEGLVLSREWSLDLAQSVCADALSGLEGFGGTSEGEFRAWLYKIALNKIRMRHRYLTAERRDARRDRDLPGEAGMTARLASVYGTIATPSRDASARESVRQLEAVIGRLSEEQRQVLSMATVLGLSYREIAEQLGKQEPAVRKILARARARLALLLAHAGNPDA